MRLNSSDLEGNAQCLSSTKRKVSVDLFVGLVASQPLASLFDG